MRAIQTLGLRSYASQSSPGSDMTEIELRGHGQCIIDVRYHRCMTNVIPPAALDQRSAAATDTGK